MSRKEKDEIKQNKKMLSEQGERVLSWPNGPKKVAALGLLGIAKRMLARLERLNDG